MTPKFDRAQRRRDLRRMKAKARRYFPDWERAALFANNLVTCSGPCCGNPRRHFGHRTLQEQRFFVEELFDD